MDTQALIDKLFSVGAHFGYARRSRHPSAEPFIFGEKGGTELFDLEQTASHMVRALEAVKKLAAERKTILFVGGKAEAREAIVRAAERLNMPYCASRWIGGTLTNWSEIKKRLARLQEISDMTATGELAKFTKHERLLIDREAQNLELMFGGLKGMTKLPDALFVIDPKAESGAVSEANQLRLPVVALLNTDCDRAKVTYPIPGNDSSRDTIELVLNEVTAAYAQNLGAAPAAAAEPRAAQV
jgi:small subunit ribosomal protein S2